MRSSLIKLLKLSTLLGLIASAGAAPLALEIQPVFSDQPVRLDSIRYASAAEEIISFSRISLLLSNFALEDESGAWIALENQSAFFDSASRRLDTMLGSMPPGQYRSIRFAVGPAPEPNHGDPAQYAADHPLNPILNNMHWNWQTGYIFLALEGRFLSAGEAAAGYVFHYANDWNRTWITLPLKLDGSQPSVLSVQLDLAALFNTPEPIALKNDGHITHSQKNDPLAARIKRNLASSFSIKRIAVQKTTAEIQTKIDPLYLPETYTPFPFKMSAAFPIPALPRDNPLTVERVALGEKLFNDKALSFDGTISCASCHKTELAFTDALPFAEGVNQLKGSRNSMPLFNLAWKSEFFWDGRAPSLREQVLQPLTNKLEMASTYEGVLEHLKNSDAYSDYFSKAFSPAEPTLEKVSLALEAYLLTLTSTDSRFDQARKGITVLTKEEQRGMELFFTEYDPRTRQFGADCFHCHGGPLFSDQQYHNNGIDRNTDKGRAVVTKKESDAFKFSTPPLRNIALTAPYMHDGRFQTLDEVIEHYTSPITPSDTLDPNLAKHPETGLQLPKKDQQALVAFLKTLVDPQY